MKEGAAPTQEKPFRMHGERGEAHKRVTQDWIDRGYLEPPVPVQSMDGNVVNKGGGPGSFWAPKCYNCEWLSQTFVVPKKIGRLSLERFSRYEGAQ